MMSEKASLSRILLLTTSLLTTLLSKSLPKSQSKRSRPCELKRQLRSSKWLCLPVAHNEAAASRWPDRFLPRAMPVRPLESHSAAMASHLATTWLILTMRSSSDWSLTRDSISSSPASSWTDSPHPSGTDNCLAPNACSRWPSRLDPTTTLSSGLDADCETQTSDPKTDLPLPQFGPVQTNHRTPSANRSVRLRERRELNEGWSTRSHLACPDLLSTSPHHSLKNLQRNIFANPNDRSTRTFNLQRLICCWTHSLIHSLIRYRIRDHRRS